MNAATVDDLRSSPWTLRLDAFCAVLGGLVPLGLIIGNTAFESMIALVGLAWIIRSCQARVNPFYNLIRHPLIVPWLAWYASILGSLAWNGPGSKGAMHDIVMIRYFLYFAAMVDTSQRRPVVRYMLFGMGAGVAWGLLNTLSAYIFGYDFLGRSLSRYASKLKEASLIACLAAYAGPFFLSWGGFSRKLSMRLRLLILLLGLVAIGQVFFVHVRTAEVAVMTAFFAMTSYALARYAGRFYFALWIILAGLCVVMFVRFGPGVDLSSSYDRIGFWKVAYSMWLENPVAGVGISAWQDAYKEMARSDLISPYISPDGRSWKALEATHAHNLLIHIISATGLLGLLSFGWLFIQALRVVLQKRDYCGHALLTWPVVFLIIGLMGWNIYGSQYQSLFAFFMALTGARWEPQDQHSYWSGSITSGPIQT